MAHWLESGNGRFNGRQPTQKTTHPNKTVCTNSLHELLLLVCYLFSRKMGELFVQTVPKLFAAQTVFLLGWVAFGGGLPLHDRHVPFSSTIFVSIMRVDVVRFSSIDIVCWLSEALMPLQTRQKLCCRTQRLSTEKGECTQTSMSTLLALQPHVTSYSFVRCLSCVWLSISHTSVKMSRKSIAEDEVVLRKLLGHKQ